MNKEKFGFGVVGLVLGILVTWAIACYAVNGNHGSIMRMMGISNNNDSSYNMTGNYSNNNQSGMMGNNGSVSSIRQGMMSGLQNKTGDEFDKAFLSEMIAHHQGAVDMSTAALSYAKHQEIKDLAKKIINAQNKEISQMHAWQQIWYK